MQNVLNLTHVIIQTNAICVWNTFELYSKNK